MNRTVLAAWCALVTVAPGWAGVVETIRATYGAQTTLTTDFDLTIFWKVREKQESNSGGMQLAPGDRFRVELGPTTWVCDGQTVWQYSTKTNQVVIKRLLDFDISTHPSQMLATYVLGYDYRVLEENERQATLQWEADSAEASAFYQQITLTFDKRKNVVVSLVVIDRHGNQSTYQFKRTVFGEQMPRSTFELAIPKGADVLDERQ
jgi:outer membrane lipoprotein-sorting protein